MTITQTEKPSATHAVDLEALKQRQKAMWASGDFAIIGTTLQIVGEQLCESMDLHAGSRVLDVACGNGHASLAAARRFCDVTGLDYVPTLLARARERAQAERLPIEFVEGDAEQLPFPDRSFDAAVSTYGVMFAPNQRRAASELTRVCKPGAKIGLASWTPEGMVGDMLRLVTKYVPPPAGVDSPLLWGTRSRLTELFGTRAQLIHAQNKDCVFRYRSPAHFVDVFRRFYGPTHKAFEALDEKGQQALEADLLNMLAKANRAEGVLVAPGQYLEAILQVQ